MDNVHERLKMNKYYTVYMPAFQ